MANPDAYANLTGWWKADSIVGLNDGDPISTWAGVLANTNITGAGATRPLYRVGQMNGKPVVRFDGVDDNLTAPAIAMSALLAAGAFTILAVVYVRSNAGTSQPIIADTKLGLNAGVALYMGAGLAATIYTYDGANKQISTAIVLGTPVILMARHDAGVLYVNKNNGSDASVAAGNTTDLTGTLVFGKDVNAVQFFDGDIAELVTYNRVLTPTERTGLHDTLRLKWLGGLPNQINQARFTGSQRLRLFRRAPGIYQTIAPPEFADVELGDDLAVSHSMIPGARGGSLRWQRGMFRVLDRTIIPGSENVSLYLRDIRPYVTSYWDVAKSLKSSTVYADGIARMDTGGTRTFTRGSSAWIRDPGDGRLVAVNFDTEKIDKDGLLLEGASTNQIIQAGFKNGATNVFTGWTQVGTASNGSSITEDTTNLLWDATIIKRSVKLLAGTPIHVADMYVQSTATASILANTVGRLSVWHRDNAAPPLNYALQRAFDAKWWRDSDQTWQVAVTWNAMTASATWAGGRALSKQINVGANATTLTLRVGIPTATGTAGQINNLAHVQWESQTFASSAILTEAAAVTRSVDQLLISDAAAARSWPNPRGTGKVTAMPNWDAADVTTVNKTILWLSHDANNYEWVYFDGVNARWAFERKVAGVVSRAVLAASPTRGTGYAIAWRWTSSEGELGLTNFTASIFVNGTKGTDVATAAAPTEAASPNMELGGKAAAENFDGTLTGWDIVPFVLTDAEVART